MDILGKRIECAKTQGCDGLRMGVLFAVFRRLIKKHGETWMEINLEK